MFVLRLWGWCFVSLLNVFSVHIAWLTHSLLLHNDFLISPIIKREKACLAFIYWSIERDQWRRKFLEEVSSKASQKIPPFANHLQNNCTPFLTFYWNLLSPLHTPHAPLFTPLLQPSVAIFDTNSTLRWTRHSLARKTRGRRFLTWALICIIIQSQACNAEHFCCVERQTDIYSLRQWSSSSSSSTEATEFNKIWHLTNT